MKHINKYRNNGINYDITSDFKFNTERIKGKYKRYLRKRTLRKIKRLEERVYADSEAHGSNK